MALTQATGIRRHVPAYIIPDSVLASAGVVQYWYATLGDSQVLKPTYSIPVGLRTRPRLTNTSPRLIVVQPPAEATRSRQVRLHREPWSGIMTISGRQSNRERTSTRFWARTPAAAGCTSPRHGERGLSSTAASRHSPSGRPANRHLSDSLNIGLDRGSIAEWFAFNQARSTPGIPYGTHSGIMCATTQKQNRRQKHLMYDSTGTHQESSCRFRAIRARTLPAIQRHHLKRAGPSM